MIWPAPLGFLNAPPGLPPAEAKKYTVRVALPTLGALMHVAQAPIFVALGIPWVLVGLSAIVSPLWFASAVWMVRRGHPRLGIWWTFLEVALHMPLLAVCLGVDAAYPLYALVLAPGAFIAFDRELRGDRVAGIVLSCSLIPLLYGWDAYSGPVFASDERTIAVLFWTNVAGVAFALVAITAYFSNAADLAEDAVEAERERSERLLRNILPDAIAVRLKAGEEGIADHFDGASVLFADLVGFTKLSARISTEELITMLNDVFSRFDALADQHGLEKIKTIGDAYMVVGGLPDACDDHADRVVAMALDMADVIRDYAAEGGHALDIRIGVHSGPVVAGVIGTRKFAYDLWGDTVNTASRMESHGEPGRVQISDATRGQLTAAVQVDERGTIEVKGKGTMKTWWVSRR